MLPQLSTLYFDGDKHGYTRNVFQLAMQQCAGQVEEKCCPYYRTLRHEKGNCLAFAVNSDVE